MTDAPVRAQNSSCGISGGRNGPGTRFTSISSGFPYQYNSIAAPYSLKYHVEAAPKMHRGTGSPFRSSNTNKRVKSLKFEPGTAQELSLQQ